MKKYLFLLVLLSMALVAVPAHATYVCDGPITMLGLGSNGVVVQGPGGLPPLFICKVDATTPANGYTPDLCKATYAMLLAAKLSGQTVLLEFNDNLTCTTQPPWTVPAGFVFAETP